MIKITDKPLEQNLVEYLSEKQSTINDIPSYSERVAKGIELWNKKSRAKFRKIRAVLTEMCVGIQRCNYCEDSVADEVEHIRPKNIYPNKIFVWENYLYSCGQCNGGKNNFYAVFNAHDKITEVSRKRGAPVTPPVQGEHVFLDPRDINPLDYMILDLETMYFIPHPLGNSREKKKAEYTIDKLRLNSRDYLVEARKQAYYSYCDFIKAYMNLKSGHASEEQLKNKRKQVKSKHHPTVWEEMKRQNNSHAVLQGLFSGVEELLQH